jgi:glycosyltransferase involved in cell wall biosynthesis
VVSQQADLRAYAGPRGGVREWLRARPRALAATDRPTVTVVIPCFNYGRFLPDAVTSALSQDGVEVDVVVVDDRSTDNSLAVARALAVEHPAVRVLAHDTNQGPVPTFNDGLEFVSGEFIVRLDADDLLTPGSLSRAAALARCYPSVGLVYGHPRHFTSEPPAPRLRVRSWTVWPGRHWLADRCRTGLSVITSPEVLMRTSVVQRIGGQQPLLCAHDTEMWLRISAFADVARVNGPDQAWHRDHPDSLMARLVDELTDLQERRAAFDVLFAGPAGSIPEAAVLQRLANRAIAREALRRACHLYDRGKATGEMVTALTGIAGEVAPVEAVSRDWRRLERRSALGADRVHRRPWYVTAAIRRRLEHEFKSRRWMRTGSYGRSLGARNFGKLQ